jgi:hypothetical protein
MSIHVVFQQVLTSKRKVNFADQLFDISRPSVSACRNRDSQTKSRKKRSALCPNRTSDLIIACNTSDTLYH